MRHGDIQVRLSLYGEPQQLLTYWRGWLREMLPVSASITIVKQRKRYRGWWLGSDPNFAFEPMTQTEKKRADLSISEMSLKMDASEIYIARQLTEDVFGWLSGRHGLPALNQSISNAGLSLTVEGGPDLILAVEKFGNPEVLSVVRIGAVYTQGEPRRPDVRWLPDLYGIDKDRTIGQLFYFEKALAEGQAKQVRALVDRAAAVFRKKVNARRARVQKRASEVLGYGAELSFEGRPITEKMLDGYEYKDILAWLDEQAKTTKPRDGMRAWRNN